MELTKQKHDYTPCCCKYGMMEAVYLHLLLFTLIFKRERHLNLMSIEEYMIKSLLCTVGKLYRKLI